MVRQTCIHTHTQLSFASDARRIQTPDTIFLQPSIRSPSNAAHPSQRMSFQSRCHVPQCPQIWQLCAPGMPFALGRRLNPFSLSVFFLFFFFSSWLIFFLVWESPSNTVGSWQSWWIQQAAVRPASFIARVFLSLRLCCFYPFLSTSPFLFSWFSLSNKITLIWLCHTSIYPAS